MKIIDEIGQCAMYEQLAEECCELGQAALKMSRILRGENPTPKTLDVAIEEFIEECSDVRCVMDMLLKPGDREKIMIIHNEKLKRWMNRIEKAKRNAKK